MTGSDYPLDDRQIRMILPHRPPMLQIDRVERCAVGLDTLIAVKLVSNADPMLPVDGGRGFFPSTLVVEALAQCSGLLMRLQWMAARDVDLVAFAAGSDAQVAALRIPRTVLAESQARHWRLARPGETLRLRTRVLARRGQMVAFAASAESATRLCTELELRLSFPENFPPAGPRRVN